MKKVHLIVGARPNFMKMAPLYKEFKKYPDKFEVKLIHTGQHYDKNMSDIFFEEMKIELKTATLKRFANTPIELSEEQSEEVGKLIERLEEDDDVQAVYTNFS